MRVQASGIDDHGAGIALLGGGGLVHVADLLPDEHADITIDHRSPHKPESWGHILRRHGAASSIRSAPACPAAGQCGGCTWQHLTLAAQHAYKRSRVVSAVAALDVVASGTVTVAEVVAAPSPLGYRNKGKYVAGASSAGLMLGAYAPRTHTLVDTLGCRVVAPLVDELAAWTQGAARAAGMVPFDERVRCGELRYVIVRANDRGEALVGLVTPTATPVARLAGIAQALGHHPAVRGVIWIRHDRTDGALVPYDAARTTLMGDGTLADRVAGVDIAVGIGEFLQINRDQATAMYLRVAELAGAAPGVRALDLYAGVGGITFALARAGAQVTAIEVDAAAVAALRAAAVQAGLTQVQAHAGDAGTIAWPSAVDVAVVNPPRRGLAASTIAALIALAPPMIIYVSCGPEALGRDLQTLQRAGFVVDTIEPFDLMPGTSQIETVVRARRK